jgi:DNA-binding transcriptional MocR family regulator
MEEFLAAKEQIALTGSVLDEAVAARCLELKSKLHPPILAKTRENFALVRAWMAKQDLLEWVEPQGGAVCFPRFRPQVKVDIDRFYEILNKDRGTYVGPGHWFDEDRRHFRIGFGWPSREELSQGLANITAAAHAATML